MLKPAICYKEEIESALKKYFYTDDMMFYQGYMNNELIEIPTQCRFDDCHFAVIGECLELIGYISYKVDLYSSCAYNFGAFSFVRSNPIMGKELFGIMEKLVNKMHKVSFRAISGNSALKGYDAFLERHKDIGVKIVFRDEFKDMDGNYRDVIYYEFVNKNK